MRPRTVLTRWLEFPMTHLLPYHTNLSIILLVAAVILLIVALKGR